jgi:hypothetical protein
MLECLQSSPVSGKESAPGPSPTWVYCAFFCCFDAKGSNSMETKVPPTQPMTFRRAPQGRSDSEAFAALLAHMPDPETTESFEDFEALIAAYEGHCLARYLLYF